MVSESRAVSPVVGVLLLVAVVVLLGALFGVMVQGTQESLRSPAPMVSFDIEYHPDGAGNSGIPYLLVTHRAGDIAQGGEVYIEDDDGNAVSWADIYMGGDTVSVGESAHIDGEGSSDGHLTPICRAGQTYRVTYDPPDRTKAIVAELTVPRPPTAPVGDCP